MKFLLKPLLTLGALVGLAAALEVGLRWFGPPARPLDDHFAFIKHAVHSPFLVFGPNRNNAYFQAGGPDVPWNHQGFRMTGSLPLETPADELRVFALGGSTTQNTANAEGLHYCGEANRILRGATVAGRRFHCINASKSAFSTAHSLIRLQFDLLPFAPDAITVLQNVNDLDVNFFPHDDPYEIPNYANKYLHAAFARRYGLTSALRGSFLRHSRLAVFLYARASSLRRSLAPHEVRRADGRMVKSSMRFNREPTVLRSKQAFRNNLIGICRIGKAHGIEVVLLSQPGLLTEPLVALAFGHKPYNADVLYPPHQELEGLFRQYNEVIRAVAEREGVHFVDMFERFGQDPDHFVDAFHFTGSGIRRFARIYADALREVLEAARPSPEKAGEAPPT